jgi:hypothetical protein
MYSAPTTLATATTSSVSALGAQHTGALTYGGTLGGGNEWGFSGDLVVDGDLYPGEDLHLATGKSIQWNDVDALTGDASANLTAEQNFTVSGVHDVSTNPFKPKIYSQAGEPDIPNDTEAIWSDSDAGPIVYKLVDIGGTQYKRALDS